MKIILFACLFVCLVEFILGFSIGFSNEAKSDVAVSVKDKEHSTFLNPTVIPKKGYANIDVAKSGGVELLVVKVEDESKRFIINHDEDSKNGLVTGYYIFENESGEIRSAISIKLGK